MKYIKESDVRKLAKEYGRRVGRGFLTALAAEIENKIIKACQVHNGGKKTLDGDVSAFIGIGKGN